MTDAANEPSATLPSLTEHTATSRPGLPGQPLPGDVVTVTDIPRTVIASVEYTDEQGLMFTLLLLNPAPPYYTVALLGAAEGPMVLDDFENIVPAVQCYQEEGGDY